MRLNNLILVLPLAFLFLQSCAPQTVMDNASDPQISVDSSENSVITATTDETTITASVEGRGSTDIGKGKNSQVSSDSSGNSVSVWEGNDGSFDVVQASIYNGQDWTPPVTISKTGSNARKPKVGAYSSRKAVAVWQKSGLIKASMYDGSAWSAPEDLGSGDSSSQQVGVDPTNGYPVVVWVKSVGEGGSQVQAAHFDEETETWIMDESI